MRVPRVIYGEGRVFVIDADYGIKIREHKLVKYGK